MKTNSFLKRGFLILATFAVSCIILTALVSCEKARETQATSDISESAVNSFAPISPDVMNELDVAALIGENRVIHNKTFISDTVIVIISSDVHKNGEHDLTYYNWKVNFIDLAAGSSISHPLREADADFSTSGCQVMDEYLYI